MAAKASFKVGIRRSRSARRKITVIDTAGISLRTGRSTHRSGSMSFSIHAITRARSRAKVSLGYSDKYPWHSRKHFGKRTNKYVMLRVTYGFLYKYLKNILLLFPTRTPYLHVCLKFLKVIMFRMCFMLIVSSKNSSTVLITCKKLSTKQIT